MPQRRTRALVATVGLALLLARPARASERVTLEWRAPPGCSEAEFRAALARHVGEAPRGGPPLQVTIAVQRGEAGRWALELGITADDASGTRHLEAGSCATLVDAAAFIVSQALADGAPPELVPEAPPPAVDATPPEAGPAPTTAETQDIPEAPPPSAVDVPAIVESAPVITPPAITTPRPPRLRAAVRVSGGVRGVALPGVSPGVALTLGLLAARWRVDLIGRGDLPTLARSTGAPDVGAKIGLWAIGARGCAVLRRARLEFPLCGGLEFGQVIGRSVGARDDGRAALLWAAATISPGLAWSPRPWIALVIEADLAITLIRRDFVVRGLPPLHRLGPVQVGGLVGVEWRFPGPRR